MKTTLCLNVDNSALNQNYSYCSYLVFNLTYKFNECVCKSNELTNELIIHVKYNYNKNALH